MIVVELLLWVLVATLTTLLVFSWYVMYQIYKEDRG